MTERILRELQGETTYNRVYGHILRIMKFDIGRVVETNLIEKLACCCSCIYSTDKIDFISKKYSDLLEAFASLDFNIRDIEVLRTLYLYAELHGLFRLAIILREKYKLLLKQCTDKQRIWRRVQCSIEDFRFDETKQLIKQMTDDGVYSRCCNREIEIASWFSSLIDDRAQIKDAYSEYLRNKRVHIYGPMDCKRQRVLDDDIVVRIDDREDRPINDRTDVLYINHEVCEIMKSYSKEYWDRYDIVSLKEGDSLSNSCNARNMKGFGCLFLFGYPNMIPLILIDLLNSGVKSINISGINLYCSKEPYGEGYEGFGVMKNTAERVERVRAWCLHDVLSQFSFMKKMYEMELFYAGDELKRVLDMSQKEYAYCMEQEHMSVLLGRK